MQKSPLSLNESRDFFDTLTRRDSLLTVPASIFPTGYRSFALCSLGLSFRLLFDELCLEPGLFFLKAQTLLFAFGLQLIFFRDAVIFLLLQTGLLPRET